MGEPFSLSRYSLEDSLKRYEEHLEAILRDHETQKRFLTLASAEEIGFFL